MSEVYDCGWLKMEAADVCGGRREEEELLLRVGIVEA